MLFVHFLWHGGHTISHVQCAHAWPVICLWCVTDQMTTPAKDQLFMNKHFRRRRSTTTTAIVPNIYIYSLLHHASVDCLAEKWGLKTDASSTTGIYNKKTLDRLPTQKRSSLSFVFWLHQPLCINLSWLGQIIIWQMDFVNWYEIWFISW